LVEAGGAILVGTDITRIVAAATDLLRVGTTYRRMQLKLSPFGDGHAARHIADRLCTAE